MLIGLVLVVVVAFFAWQWWSAAGRKALGAAAGRNKVADKEPAGSAPQAPGPRLAEPAPIASDPPTEEKFPVVAGQSEANLRAKEPVQARTPPSTQMPGPSGHGPAAIEDNLRHPEQAFHQPAPRGPLTAASPDVPAGLSSAAAAAAVPPGGAQMFAPEMAQNGGAIVGNSVFAFDGMEPTGFAAF